MNKIKVGKIFKILKNDNPEPVTELKYKKLEEVLNEME